MAGKKKEMVVQIELSTQEEWNDMISKPGLLLVDVTQNWGGPCAPLLNLFRTLKLSLQDEMLQFAVGKAESVFCLKRFKGRSIPTWLFIGSGRLLFVQLGPDMPVIEKLIATLLQNEHDILEDKMKRKCMVDPHRLSLPRYKRNLEQDELEMEPYRESPMSPPFDVDYEIPVTRPIFIILLEPFIVSSKGKIYMQIEKAGFEIVKDLQRVLTAEEFSEIYDVDPQDVDQILLSKSSYVYVVRKEKNPENDFRKLVGLTSDSGGIPEGNSLRAKYAKEDLGYGIYGSPDGNIGLTDVLFFFPDFKDIRKGTRVYPY